VKRPLCVGTDFGGTKIRAGVVCNGAVLGAAEAPTEAAGGLEHVLAQLERAIAGACDAAGVAVREIGALGVAAPGQIDLSTHTIVHAPNLGWRDVPLARLLAERFGLPVAIDNDVNAACLGEAEFGAGRGFRDVAAIFVGTGIGGGVIANGVLLAGATGAAGEIGHMVYRAGGDPCSCGRRGHFESYAGGGPVERTFRERVRGGLETAALALAGGDPDRIDTGTIFEAACRGDPASREVVAEMERALGTLAANVASFLNPARIVMGGGVVRKQRALVEACAHAVRELATEAAARACQVVESALGKDAAVLGSAESAFRRAARCAGG
jgi:glucokinase